jgi:hypothetical protein
LTDPALAKGPGLFLSLDELSAIFPRLKRNESLLAAGERRVLSRMEKTLYEHLSVADIETRLGGSLEQA